MRNISEMLSDSLNAEIEINEKKVAPVVYPAKLKLGFSKKEHGSKLSKLAKQGVVVKDWGFDGTVTVEVQDEAAGMVLYNYVLSWLTKDNKMNPKDAAEMMEMTMNNVYRLSLQTGKKK